MIRLSEVLRHYRLHSIDLQNTPIDENGKPVDPLIDLSVESYSGSSNLVSITGYVVEELKTIDGQSLTIPPTRDRSQYFEIATGCWEWRDYPDSQFRKSINLSIFGTEYRDRKDWGFLFTKYPSSWKRTERRCLVVPTKILQTADKS